MTLEEDFEEATKKFNRLASLIVRRRMGIPCGEDHDYSTWTAVKCPTENGYCWRWAGTCRVCGATVERDENPHLRPMVAFL